MSDAARDLGNALLSRVEELAAEVAQLKSDLADEGEANRRLRALLCDLCETSALDSPMTMTRKFVAEVELSERLLGESREARNRIVDEAAKELAAAVAMKISVGEARAERYVFRRVTR